MLLVEIKEIKSYLPTSKWRDADALLSYVEEEEQNVLVPILGESLFDELVEVYQDRVGRSGGITPDLMPSNEVDSYIRLIRLCQKVELYMALANNVGLLAVSFNQGGGFNVTTSDNYDNADKDALNRLEKDAFRKAHRNIEALLAELERDAKSEKPLFAEKWRESRYFYFDGRLLVSRAAVLQMYLDIGNSRERYIELVPDLRYAQTTYLLPALGRELMQAFVSRNTIGVPNEKNAPIPEANEGHTEEWKKQQLVLWLEAEDRLRAALANYAEHRNVKLRRPDSLTDADMSLAQGVAIIRENQEYFMPYVATAPFYVESASTEEKEADPHCICGEPAKFDPCDPNNAITVLRPGLRRY